VRHDDYDYYTPVDQYAERIKADIHAKAIGDRLHKDQMWRDAMMIAYSERSYGPQKDGWLEVMIKNAFKRAYNKIRSLF
jgi:hypothetical protein